MWANTPIPHNLTIPLGIGEIADELETSAATIQGWITTGQVKLGTGDAESPADFSADQFRQLRCHRVVLDIRELFADADAFLDTPHPRMGGYTPRELLGTEQEQLVIDFVEGIKHGVAS